MMTGVTSDSHRPRNRKRDAGDAKVQVNVNSDWKVHVSVDTTYGDADREPPASEEEREDEQFHV